MSNTGGPAFPVKQGYYEHGMSLRDYFAAEAMQAIIIAESPMNYTGSSANVATAAYFMADAMLKARGEDE